jgi:hypothetical protein
MGPDALSSVENESESTKYENETDNLGIVENVSGNTKHENEV